MAHDLIFGSSSRDWSRDSVVGSDDAMGRLSRAERRARHQKRIASLRARAAAGDQRALAKLRRMQAELSSLVTSVPAASIPAASATVSPTVPPAGLTAEQIRRYYPSYAASLPQAAVPVTYPTSYPTPYPAQPQYAYQSPYYDPELSQDPYGPPSQPTIDVYQGEPDIAHDAGCAEREALARIHGDDLLFTKY